MVATAHEPTLKSDPQVKRNFVAGLAEASQYTRQHRDEAVEIFAKWVPGLDVQVGKKDQLLGRLKERYGMQKDAAEKELDKFLKNVNEPPPDTRH